jgi:hypothetical protein
MMRLYRDDNHHQEPTASGKRGKRNVRSTYNPLSNCSTKKGNEAVVAEVFVRCGKP